MRICICMQSWIADFKLTIVVFLTSKGMKGVCIIAGDISPIDVISHLPVFCEESAVPYVYVPSKQDLGAAAMTKRPTSCVLIVPRDGFKADEELYAECSQYMKKVAIDV